MVSRRRRVRGGAGAGHFHRAGLGKVRTFRHGAARDDLRRGRLHRGVRHRRAAGALGRARKGAEHLPCGQRPGKARPACSHRRTALRPAPGHAEPNVDLLAPAGAGAGRMDADIWLPPSRLHMRVPSSIGGPWRGAVLPDQYGIRDAGALRDAQSSASSHLIDGDSTTRLTGLMIEFLAAQHPHRHQVRGGEATTSSLIRPFLWSSMPHHPVLHPATSDAASPAIPPSGRS